MQRHLALLRELFPIPKSQRIDGETADQILERAKQQLNALHSQHRARAVEAITAKNHLQNQVDSLAKKIQNFQEKADKAVGKGHRELADQLLREKQGYEESLRSAEETLQRAVETAEQIKVTIKREEDWIYQAMTATVAFQEKWKDCAIQHEMQRQLEGLGVWHLAQPPQPPVDRKTARELVFFLLLLIVGLLVWRLTAD
nr:PspA/IM30 family protein [Armatimonas sp.]